MLIDEATIEPIVRSAGFSSSAFARSATSSSPRRPSAACAQRFPDAHLTYIVEPAAAPVVTGNPASERRHRRAGAAAACRRVRTTSALIRAAARAAQFDMAIDFHGGPRELAHHLAVGRARARRTTTSADARGCTPIRVRDPDTSRPRHAVLNQWDLLGALGILEPDAGWMPAEMAIDSGCAAASVAKRLADEACGANDRLIVVHVSAGNPFRRWPLDRFAVWCPALARGGCGGVASR